VDELVCKCKCGFIYCLLHRLPEKHGCTYNFKIEKNVADYIEKNKCVGEKCAKI
jgi:predicted nucleic acid binding AN1-type Zn finger protein